MNKSTPDIGRYGYTLTEIMIVVTIIGLIAGISVTSIQRSRKETLKKIAFNNSEIILNAIDQFNLEMGQSGTNKIAISTIADYIKGGIIGLAIGSLQIDPTKTTDGTESPESLAKRLYPDVF